jgi:hypothetical protein
MQSDIIQKAVKFFNDLIESHTLKGSEYLTTEFDHILTRSENLSTWNHRYPKVPTTVIEDYTSLDVCVMGDKIVSEEMLHEQPFDVCELTVTIVGEAIYVQDKNEVEGFHTAFDFCPHHKYSVEFLHSVDFEALDLTNHINIETL